MDFDGTLTLPEWDEDNEIWTASDKPNWKNINLLVRLAKKGYEIHIITARNSKYEPSLSSSYGNYGMGVYDFLNSYGIAKYVKDVHFAGNDNPAGDKKQKFQELKPKKHYDDAQEHLEEANELGIKGKKIKHPVDEGRGVPPENNKTYQDLVRKSDEAKQRQNNKI